MLLTLSMHGMFEFTKCVCVLNHVIVMNAVYVI